MARVSLRDLREHLERLRKWTGLNYVLNVAYGKPRVSLQYAEGGQADVSPRLSSGELEKWLWAYQKGMEHFQELKELRRKFPAEDIEKPWMRNRGYRENPRLTKAQIERLADLLAYGPLHRKLIDDELEQMGWIEIYETFTEPDPVTGEPPYEAVWCVKGAGERLYDETGFVREHLQPLSWIRKREQRMKGRKYRGF